MHLLTTFQADLAVWIDLSTTFPADLSSWPTKLSSKPTKFLHDHILFEIVFEILDFTYSPDEHTSCPTKLRNNFVAGPLYMHINGNRGLGH